MAGLLWTYMGPGEPPLLPRFDVFARDDGVRAVENFGLWPANYFQICENSVDQSHTTMAVAGPAVVSISAITKASMRRVIVSFSC